MRAIPRLLAAAAMASAPCLAYAQGFCSADPVIRRVWQVGMNESQLERVAQVLIDSIGPRLSGSPGFTSAANWLERAYAGLDIPVRTGVGDDPARVFEFVSANQVMAPVAITRRVSGVSESGYYAWRKRGPSARA